MYLNDPLQTHARPHEYALNVLTALRRLVRDAALDQGALGVCGDLAGDEDLRACDDGLGLSYPVSISSFPLYICASSISLSLLPEVEV